MLQLGQDQAAYRQKAGLNAQARSDFANRSKAYLDNLKGVTDTAQSNVGIGTENRANLALLPAIAREEAQTDLYKQQTESAKQVEADRIRMQKLAEQLDSEKDPEKRRILERQYRILSRAPLEKPTVIQHTTMGPDGFTPVHTPYIFDPETRAVTPAIPPAQGSVEHAGYRFPNQAALDAYKKKAGIK
jgi:hypothetical protein